MNMDETIDVDGDDNVGGNDCDFNDEEEEDIMMEENDDDNDKDDDNDCEFTFLNIIDVVPCVGMLFDTLDEAEKFYRDYGRNIGFDIIIRNTHRHTRSHDPSSRMFICKKGGRLAPESHGKGKRIRDVIPRTDCRVRMCVAHQVKMNKWKITSIKLKHNHAMVTPDKTRFFRRPHNIDPITRSLIELFNKSGIKTTKIMRLLSASSGGVQNLGFSNQDTHNVIRDIRRRVFDEGDAKCSLVLLRKLQQKSSNGEFFYRVDVDDENRVRDLVWVDPRSMNAYKNFGDVVTFDSTYRTNRYCMPFIPITG
ncbi:hypothetical protein POM88_028457 [Heracleum sosnowskyi]|uniref:FAR1 domain-containing protein n=1 Tax=Heracleum sosnowskyi TaxID=360622 RepID=A0AAD8HRV5_9APIA|nr:hypothetical protein POM88_028457 [Heracleum sosnowskyi]